MDASILPHVNVTLNATSAVLLTAGFAAIRARRISLHRGLMLAATICAGLFLISYVVYHAKIGGGKKYTGPYGGVYFPILISHVVLAAVNLPMVVTTLRRALGGRYELHRRIARVTLPLWWYVSVTGVLVYVMLY